MRTAPRGDLLPVAVIGSFCVAVLGLILLGLLPALVPALALPETPCAGEPVVLDVPYQGTPEGPHSCRPQCEDGRRRYLVYADGRATQCEEPPGCSDWGEDHGITCRPPPRP